ncbi:MAG: RIP metalloprotease RseP [Candidatus Omnitrophica bacterium]|nr:RIP metalloprotease RseP [Candidatus Omnitrophota bacterium]
MISLLVFLFILGILIVVHELGHFMLARKVGVQVEKFSLGFGPKIVSKIVRDTEYDIRLIPLGGYVKLAGDNPEEYKGGRNEYLSKSPLQRALIIFFGPLFNYILGFLCFWLIFFTGYPMLTTKVGGLIDGLGAKAAGIQAGDKITGIEGKKVLFWEDIQKAVLAQKDKEVVGVSLLRGDKEYNIEVRLEQRQLEDPIGGKRRVALLGIAPFMDEVVRVRHGIAESFVLSAGKIYEMTVLTYKALFKMATGATSMRESLTGPLGIFYITSKAASIGLIAVLHLIAVISVSLGLFNLLPLPLLDGGHIFLLAVEKFRGRPLSPKSEQAITKIGLAMIIMLAAFVTYNDLMRFFGDKIASFFNR